MVKMTENPHRRSDFTTSAIAAEREVGTTAEEFIERVNEESIHEGFEAMYALSHGVSYLCGWHHDAVTGEPVEWSTGDRIALMHSELSEALEGDRKGLMDDHLPHRLSIEVELADLLHRVFDFAGQHRLDLAGAYMDKARYNATRADHKPENRAKEGGKSY